MTVLNASNEMWRAWKDAKRLSIAWRLFADPELMAQWRSADEVHLKAVHRRAIELDIQDRLASGLLSAIGIAPGAQADGECVIIRPTFFESDSCEIDWTHGELRSLERRFEDVRVFDPAAVIGDAIAPKPPMSGAVAKRGRLNLYERCAEILAEMLQEPAYRDAPAGQMLDDFNVRYVERFSTQIRQAPNVSERTLRTHLAAFRQQSANIGKN